ncbi:MAG TPA: hypothetical protein EYP56_12870 [Planctomycetaceae bacterium]|nr:hypothetical protein [Planctomycetaceae bacterium]
MCSESRGWRAVDLGRVGLVVLAAGRSERMGAPKALVSIAGRHLLEHLLQGPVIRRLVDVVVVLGHHSEAVEPVVRRLGFRWVLDPLPDRGRTGSVQRGLAAFGAKVTGVFIQPVDCPLVREETYLALAGKLHGADVAVPALGRRRGHPPLVAARMFPTILAAPADKPLRELLGAPGVRRRIVPVEDPGVLVNVDRPEDLLELEELYRRAHRS